MNVLLFVKDKRFISSKLLQFLFYFGIMSVARDQINWFISTMSISSKRKDIILARYIGHSNMVAWIPFSSFFLAFLKDTM